jgi:hypothetical protein
VLSAEAAVELLIAHRAWLSRRDFVSEAVEVLDSTPDDAPMAFVDWPVAIGALEAGRLGCSSSEGQVLRVAASIAEGIPVDLRDTTCGLDRANARRVADALVHAAGHGHTRASMEGVR